MAKSSIVYECTSCGAQSPKWAGQCPECGKWNTLVETVNTSARLHVSTSARRLGAKLQGLDDIVGNVGKRLATGIGELDRVLGGGLVAGEVCLMVGEPGIGKSTLLTQLALHMSQVITNNQAPIIKQKNSQIHTDQTAIGDSTRSVVYVCGEESPGQVKLRVERLRQGIGEARSSDHLPTSAQGSELGEQCRDVNLQMLAETDVDAIIATVDARERTAPTLLIVDSVQTLYSTDLPGLAGSVSQIRECTGRLIAYAKRSNVPIILVGHVTKDGEMAGPKVLEHMVDAVLELTGDRYYDLRLLRTQKNRFGATDEVGVFRMNETGMEEVPNPSELFLSEREVGAVGSAVAVTMEGTRPVLVEVQALVVDSELPVPRRVAQGVDVRRVQILLGVLQKYTRVNIGTKDVFVKVTGGLTVKEPAVDLAICLAVVSSATGKSLPKNAVAIGEVGLLGEIRSVLQLSRRVKEAQKLGYTTIYSRDTFKKVSELVGRY